MLHSLWQFALLALCFQLLLKSVNTRNANLRSTICTAAMGLCLLVSGFTFYEYLQVGQAASLSTAVLAMSPTSASFAETILLQPALGFMQAFMQTYMEWMVLVWALGCAVLSLKLLLEALYCQRLKSRDIQVISPEWQARFAELKAQLGVSQQVLLRWSNAVAVPCVIGYLKPVILVPSSVVLGLSPAQVEMILLHELAHIRRNEALMNTLQMLLKTLFFFNPAAYFLSNKADQEREHACDDIAVQASGNPMLYAQTLQSFAAMNLSFSPTAALLERKSMLKQRVTRLFEKSEVVKNTGIKSMSVVLITILSLGFSGFAYTNQKTEEVKTVKEVPVKKDELAVRFQVEVYKNQKLVSKPSILTHFDAEASVAIGNEIKFSVLAKQPVDSISKVSAKIYLFSEDQWILKAQPSMQADLSQTPSIEYTSKDKVNRVVIKPLMAQASEFEK
jgi:beta-lactamase regulating signal transducer with metallopeptidase domain